MDNVSFSLPPLQPVATRLQHLEFAGSHLRGSAAGFLSAHWTAVTSLWLHNTRVIDDVLTTLHLPALEHLEVIGFDHRGGVLLPDQLCCPKLCSLELQLDGSLVGDGTGSRQRRSLLNLARLTSLNIRHSSHLATMDLGLPASLTRLVVYDQSTSEDLEWALL